MFGDLNGMLGKLKDAQQKIEETKKRLHSILIDEEVANGNVKVTVTAARTVKNIAISNEITDYEALEDYLILALNKALSKANDISEKELAAAAKDGMPNIPGLNLFD